MDKREFLTTGLVGLGFDLAATSAGTAQAVTTGQAPGVNPSMVGALGQYAGTAFSQSEAARVATLLAAFVPAVRGVNPPNYLNVAPAFIVSVPRGK
jgi:hypothetical protein